MTGDMPPGQVILHAGCVAVDGRGLLIRGASGAGKSALALQMMALGAELVGDDRILLDRDGDGLRARAAPNLAGLIEARGLGILKAAARDHCRIAAVIDLDRDEPDRLPPLRQTQLLGQSVTLLYRVPGAHAAAAHILFLKAGRQDPT